jgi:hypothetical protein
VEPNGIAKQEPPGSHWWFDPKVEESKSVRRKEWVRPIPKNTKEKKEL